MVIEYEICHHFWLSLNAGGFQFIFTKMRRPLPIVNPLHPRRSCWEGFSYRWKSVGNASKTMPQNGLCCSLICAFSYCISVRVDQIEPRRGLDETARTRMKACFRGVYRWPIGSFLACRHQETEYTRAGGPYYPKFS